MHCNSSVPGSATAFFYSFLCGQKKFSLFWFCEGTLPSFTRPTHVSMDCQSVGVSYNISNTPKGQGHHTFTVLSPPSLVSAYSIWYIQRRAWCFQQTIFHPSKSPTPFHSARKPPLYLLLQSTTRTFGSLTAANTDKHVLAFSTVALAFRSVCNL